MLSTGALVVFAASDTMPAYPTQPPMLHTADEALNALTRVHATCLALFNNDIEAAKSRMTEARGDFLSAEKDLKGLTIGDIEVPDSAARYLPFDMSMMPNEDLTVTNESQQALDKASDLIQQGDDG